MRGRHLRVRFKRSRKLLEDQLSSEELSSKMASSEIPGLDSMVPNFFLRPPLLQDNDSTPTSEAQLDTIEECLPLLGAITDPTRNPFDFNEYGVPDLQREDHIDFCHQNLAQFPAPFVGLDASRPWLVYWSLLSLHLLGEDVSFMRQR